MTTETASEVLEIAARHEGRSPALRGQLLGGALSMAAGGQEEHLARIRSGHASRKRNRYGDGTWADWYRAQDFAPDTARKRLYSRWKEESKAGTTAETLEAWCTQQGLELPPTPAVANPGAFRRTVGDSDCLPGQVRAAAREEPWVAWVLLIAGRHIPTNPNELNFRLELFP